jgi:hypothetical protein
MATETPISVEENFELQEQASVFFLSQSEDFWKNMREVARTYYRPPVDKPPLTDEQFEFLWEDCVVEDLQFSQATRHDWRKYGRSGHYWKTAVGSPEEGKCLRFQGREVVVTFSGDYTVELKSLKEETKRLKKDNQLERASVSGDLIYFWEQSPLIKATVPNTVERAKQIRASWNALTPEQQADYNACAIHFREQFPLIKASAVERMKQIGASWKALTPEQRAVYDVRAKEMVA